jgi:acetyltransferase-like isoleucine patch superfamily enzyme
MVKRAYRKIEDFYVHHFLRPQLEYLGEGFRFMKPWHVELFGWPIRLGRCINVLAAPDHKVRFSVWGLAPGEGRIEVEDYCLICPGVRLQSAKEVRIGQGTMLAAGVYVTDSDWHDLYNRLEAPKNSAPVIIGPNVWVGDSAIICKGVTIGENSVVGAGAVVVDDVPANTIVAGNPARVVKDLDGSRIVTTRAHWFADPAKLEMDIRRLERDLSKGNTFGSWLRHMFFPVRGE